MTTPCLFCQTVFESGTCTHKSGRGATDDPYVIDPVFEDAATQMLECGPAGAAAFIPAWLTDPPVCNVYSNVEENVGHGAAKKLIFNQSRYDTDSMHDPLGDDPSRITIKTAGVYLITFNARWDHFVTAPDTGDVAAYIMKNGSEYMTVDSFPIGQADTFLGHSIAIKDEFQAGEYVQTAVLHSFKLDGLKRSMRITIDRMSPIFAASFLRPLPS